MTDDLTRAVDGETDLFLLSQAMSPVAGIDRTAPSAPTVDDAETLVMEAMLDCISRWGIAKTTAEDIARAAGISRATLYRMFPGGMEVVFDALLHHEAARFFDAVTDRLEAATTLEDLLVIGVTDAARFLAGHEALAYVLAHEPERVLPTFAFHRLDPALAIATAFTAPHLCRFLTDDDAAGAGAEWLVRILLSYAINPSPTLELTNPASVRRFVATYLLPAFDENANPEPAPKER
ncbi:MAG: helix-turn-helix domain-containing protein [Acidimicrobiales bacterium]